ELARVGAGERQVGSVEVPGSVLQQPLQCISQRADQTHGAKAGGQKRNVEPLCQTLISQPVPKVAVVAQSLPYGQGGVGVCNARATPLMLATIVWISNLEGHAGTQYLCGAGAGPHFMLITCMLAMSANGFERSGSVGPDVVASVGY